MAKIVKEKVHSSKNTEEVKMTPADFAKKYHTSLPNVYFWIRTEKNIGYKEGPHWYLRESDVEYLSSKIRKKDSPKTMINKTTRRRSTVSEYTLHTKLGIDKKTANLMKLLIEDYYADQMLSWFTKISGFEFQNKFRHEIILSFLAYVLGTNEVHSIRIKDGYPVYKYVKYDKGVHKETIVYSIEEAIYYLDCPETILDSNENLIDEVIEVKA